MDSHKNISAIVLGLETNGLSLVRALGRNNVSVVILEENHKREQVHLKTRYGKKILLQDLTGKPLLTFLKQYNLPNILFPTTDKQVKWLSENRHLLPEKTKILFPSKEVVQCLLDKKNFFRLCAENDLPIAAYTTVSPLDNIHSAVQNLRFPIIIKTPQKSYKANLEKAYIVQSQAELSALWKKIKKLSHEFIIQEFIPGDDSDVYFCMQYVNQSGKLLASFTGRKIRQWKPLCGGTASCEPVYEPALKDITFEIFKKSEFWGIGSVEYKRDRRNGIFYIIEPTVCRTDFQEGIAIANGVNIPLIAYRDATGMPVNPVIKDGGGKSWMHLMHDRLAANYYMKKGDLTTLDWLMSLLNTRAFDLLSFSDPKPFIFALFTKIKRKFFRVVQ